MGKGFKDRKWQKCLEILYGKTLRGTHDDDVDLKVTKGLTCKPT